MTRSSHIPRPEVGALYPYRDDVVEVCAVAESVVVCDQERVFTREEFAEVMNGDKPCRVKQ